MAVIMEGFDTVLVSDVDLTRAIDADQIGSCLGFASFNNTFGNQVVDGVPSITAPWQSAGKLFRIFEPRSQLTAP